jgi:DNA-binding transcriptional MerR regulator
MSDRTRDREAADPRRERFLTVTELARELGVTARALRFYEDKGLITPSRAATTRVYTHRERARMILILRGKRLGFSLREIKDYLDLYDADPKRITQTTALLKKIESRRATLEEQRVALDQALRGLDDLEIDARAVLARAKREATGILEPGEANGAMTTSPVADIARDPTPEAKPRGRKRAEPDVATGATTAFPRGQDARSRPNPRAPLSEAPPADHQEPCP